MNAVNVNIFNTKVKDFIAKLKKGGHHVYSIHYKRGTDACPILWRLIWLNKSIFHKKSLFVGRSS